MKLLLLLLLVLFVPGLPPAAAEGIEHGCTTSLLVMIKSVLRGHQINRPEGSERIEEEEELLQIALQKAEPAMAK